MSGRCGVWVIELVREHEGAVGPVRRPDAVALARAVVAAVMGELFLAPKELRPISHAPIVVVRLLLLCGGAVGLWLPGLRTSGGSRSWWL